MNAKLNRHAIQSFLHLVLLVPTLHLWGEGEIHVGRINSVYGTSWGVPALRQRQCSRQIHITHTPSNRQRIGVAGQGG